MKDANSTTNGTKSAGSSNMEVPQAVREMVEKGASQARQAYDKMNVATTEASQVLQEACSTASLNATACNTKVMEFARVNTNAAFDYASALMTVKSPSDFVKLASEHARRQFEVLSAQANELAALSQKAMTDAAAPIKAAVTKGS